MADPRRGGIRLRTRPFRKGIRRLRGIVLIAIDCLRADHVSCYGYHRATTPTIDGLGAKGIVWEQASSVSSWTKPSVASLFTGLYPSQHGAFHGIKRSKDRSVAKTDVLLSGRPTISEVFTDAGWRCGAFINNEQLGTHTRLDRGFETYTPAAGKADRLLAQFEDWLRRDASTPFFAYLHFLEAHWPYKPRRRHIAMFGGDRDANRFRDFSARDYGRLRQRLARGEATLSGAELEQMMQMYDGAVRRLDGKVKFVLQLLERLGIRDQTGVVVTADHGEEFMEHGRIGHGHALYEEVIHVPLVAALPGGPKGIRAAGPVSLVDIPHTLLNAAGVDHAVAGHDLLSVGGEPSAVVAELSIGHRYDQMIRDGDWKLHRSYQFESNRGQAALRRSYRDRVASEPHRLSMELYNLATDPREQADLADDSRHEGRKKELTAKLDQWWKENARRPQDEPVKEVDLDERTLRRLRDLGYLE